MENIIHLILQDMIQYVKFILIFSITIAQNVKKIYVYIAIISIKIMNY